MTPLCIDCRGKHSSSIKEEKWHARSGRKKRKRNTNESSQPRYLNGSREGCNDSSTMDGSGKIPKPISLIRQKFPRLRAKRERGSLDKRQSSTKALARPRERMLSTPKSSIFIYSKYLASFFSAYLILPPLFALSCSPFDDEISIERVAHV